MAEEQTQMGNKTRLGDWEISQARAGGGAAQGGVIYFGIYSGAFAPALDVGSRGKGGVKDDTWGWWAQSTWGDDAMVATGDYPSLMS